MSTNTKPKLDPESPKPKSNKMPVFTVQYNGFTQRGKKSKTA